MHSDFDPDDNFAQAHRETADLDDDAALEAIAWQLLLLVNPGDDDAAQAQFAQWQEASPDLHDVDAALDALQDAIDWRAGFRTAEDDAQGLIECLDELAARWRVDIDWDLDDDEDLDVPQVLDRAFDRLREHHYTLWVRETADGAQAGWITRSADDDGMRAIAAALALPLRPAGM